MYRYFLFFCDTYYPSGGMDDCVLKTNNLDDLEKRVHSQCENDYYIGTIHYYDAVEDKTWYAKTEEYTTKDYLIRWKFTGWEDNNYEYI